MATMGPGRRENRRWTMTMTLSPTAKLPGHPGFRLPPTTGLTTGPNATNAWSESMSVCGMGTGLASGATYCT